MTCDRTTDGCTRWLRWASIYLCFAAAATTGVGCRGIESNSGRQATAELPVVPPNDKELVAASFAETLARQIRNPDESSAAQPTVSGADNPPQGAVAGQRRPGESIDLSSALRLAGVDNPTINLAEERIQEALAGQLAARSLLIPSVNVGGNLRLHRGAYQDDPGFLLSPNSQGLYVGAGARAIGAGSVAIPGVWLFTQLGDAVYEPLVARQRVAARQSDAQAVRNEVLLNVATAYLELVGAEARLKLLRRAESDVTEIVRITGAFAKTGQGARSDANRAAANAALIRRQIVEAEGEVAGASTRLCRLLNLDPSARLRAPAGSVESIRLVAEETDLESLLADAVQFRPELIARSALIEEADTQVRQERVRPWLPLLAVGYSAGEFGGGSNQVADRFGPLLARSDLTVIAFWNVQNLGVGNHARLRRARSIVGQMTAGYEIALNQVRREVTEAQAAAKTAARQMESAKGALTAAEEGFRIEADRIKLGQGRPIEALDSFRQLLESREELLRAIVAFDMAQFQLFVALGGNPESGQRPRCGAFVKCQAAPP